MSTGPEGKAPADAEPAFIETADTQEQTVADAAESTPDVQRPGKNASKPEVQKWARDLGVSDEGTVKEIFARVDKETASSEQGGPVLVQDATGEEPEHEKPGKVDLSEIPQKPRFEKFSGGVGHGWETQVQVGDNIRIGYRSMGTNITENLIPVFLFHFFICQSLMLHSSSILSLRSVW